MVPAASSTYETVIAAEGQDHGFGIPVRTRRSAPREQDGAQIPTVERQGEQPLRVGVRDRRAESAQPVERRQKQGLGLVELPLSGETGAEQAFAQVALPRLRAGLLVAVERGRQHCGNSAEIRDGSRR